jgi:4-oxalocrotonate tautomerase
MPYLSARLCTRQSPETTGQVAAILTDLTAELLGKNRGLASVTVEYVSAEQWFLGGKALAAHGLATFYLDVKVTDGTNTKDEKAVYVGHVFAALESLLGRLHPASYIVIHDVRADSWGYGGATQESRYIRGKAA